MKHSDNQHAHSTEAEASPVLDLLMDGEGRLLRGRLSRFAATLAGRAGRRRAIALWPALDRPRVAVDLGGRAPASWIVHMSGLWEDRRRGLVSRIRSLVGEAAWIGLRSAGVLVGGTGGVAVAAAEQALGRKLNRPMVALFSPSGAPTAKANLFVFEGDSPEPLVLVVTMAQRYLDQRLRTELASIEAVRSRLDRAPEVAAALPLQPIATLEIDTRFVAVLPVDPLSPNTGVEAREQVFSWLRSFQAATATQAHWGDADIERELATVSEAWHALRPASHDAVLERARLDLRRMRGLEYRPSAVHGDFWRGNIGVSGREVRVYDWEWAREHGHPLFDPWTYELAELKFLADAGRRRLAIALSEARDRVRDVASSGGLEPGMADWMLIPVLAELAIRNRRVSGQPSPPEIPLREVMAAAEDLNDD